MIGRLNNKLAFLKMIFGNKEIFAIECYHDPISNDRKWVYGRMCLWCSGIQVGDIEETGCMLNVTEGFLQNFIESSNELSDKNLNKLGDRDLYKFLDEKLYSRLEKSREQIVEDSRTYRKFDFLTNGGASFDTIRCFIVRKENKYKLLLTDRFDDFYSFHIDSYLMENVIIEFLIWMSNEKAKL